jgi:hypothetical protein
MPGCDEVLRHGIFNQTKIDSDQSFRRSFYQWLYDMDFHTHDEAIAAGLSVGMVVFGVPLQIGGTFTKQQKDTWRHDHAEYKSDDVSTAHKYSIITSSVSPEIMNAWLACVRGEQANRVFGAVAEDQGADIAVVTVIWNPLEGDTGANPVVLASEIAGGTRMPDGKGILFDPSLQLKKGKNQVVVKRVHGQPLIAIVHTTRGDVTANESAVVDLPEITEFSATPTSIPRGSNTTLKWSTSNATQVTINNGVGQVGGSGAVVDHPGSSLTYTLTAANSAGSVNRQVSVEVKPVEFTGLTVVFDVGNDDKDDDTQISVVITKGGRQLAEWHQTSNECWHDWHQYQKGLALAGSVTTDDIAGATFGITISPNGHDDFHFTVSLRGSRNDGGTYGWNGGYHELSHNNRTMSATLPAP